MRNSVVPDGHVGARDTGKLDGSRETLVTLRVIVLKTDLELDGLEEVSLLGVLGVLKELLHVGAHSGDCDLGHLSDSLPINESIGEDWRFVVQEGKKVR